MSDDIRAYVERWEAVADIEREELRTETIEMRWQQLKSVIGLAIGLGIYQQDGNDVEIYERWARLKEQSRKRPE